MVAHDPPPTHQPKHLAEVTAVDIDMEKQTVTVTSELDSDSLLETIKKTGKVCLRCSSSWSFPGVSSATVFSHFV